MKKLNKKILLPIGILIIVLLGSVLYLNNNQNKSLDEFTNYLNEYKNEMSNYSLIDNEDSYNNLISESEQAISNKNHKDFNSLKDRLDKLKDNILNKNNELLKNFSNYLDTYKQELTNFNLNDSKERYNELITEAEQILSNKTYKNIDTMTSNLNKFKEELLNKNIETLNNSISELENIDISKISDKESITNKISEIKKLKNEKQFIKATELANTLKLNIHSQLQDIKNSSQLEDIKNTENFDIYTALNYILKTDRLNYLSGKNRIDHLERKIENPYLAYFEFIDNKLKVPHELLIFHLNSHSASLGGSIIINPKYKDLDFYTFKVKEIHTLPPEGYTIKYTMHKGIVYRNGIVEFF